MWRDDLARLGNRCLRGARHALSPGTRRLLLVACALGLLPVSVSAHPALKASAPSNGSRVAVPPRLIRLEFTEAVELTGMRLVLRTTVGDTIALSRPRYEGSAGRVIVADVSDSVPPGAVGVTWAVIGRDGHPANGRFTFSVTGRAPVGSAASAVAESASAAAPMGDTASIHRAPASPDSAATSFGVRAGSPLYTLVRLLSFIVMLGAIGTVAFSTVILPRATALDASTVRDVLARVGRVAVLCAQGLVLVAVARLVLQSLVVRSAAGPAAPATLELVTGTVWGTGWMLQVAGAILLWVAAATRTRVARSVGPAGIAAVIVIALSAAMSGHAAASPRGPALTVTLDALHVLAAGAWLGSLFSLLVRVIPAVLSAPAGARDDMVRSLVSAFSPVALVSGGLLLLTGALGAWLELGAIGPLFSSAWGRLLLLKLGVAAGVAAMGAYNWRFVQPQLGSNDGTARLRRTVPIELVLGTVVLIVTAVLTATPPPIGGS